MTSEDVSAAKERLERWIGAEPRIYRTAQGTAAPTEKSDLRDILASHDNLSKEVGRLKDLLADRSTELDWERSARQAAEAKLSALSEAARPFSALYEPWMGERDQVNTEISAAFERPSYGQLQILVTALAALQPSAVPVEGERKTVPCSRCGTADIQMCDCGLSGGAPPKEDLDARRERIARIIDPNALWEDGQLPDGHPYISRQLVARATADAILKSEGSAS